MGLFHSKCTSTTRLDGKVAVITGCNTGIGKECSKDFYIRGAKVIMACRNVEKANEAVKDIQEECKDQPKIGSLKTVKLDLTSLKSVRECAQQINESETKIDILLNNAGVMACPESRTEDGFEMQFGTNHLGHFLFTMLLMPKILASDSDTPRIVNVSSAAHFGGKMDFEDLNWKKRPYSPMRAYCQTKLANILFSKELARRLQDAGFGHVHTYSLHPGVINTELGRHIDQTLSISILFLIRMYSAIASKTPEQGAQTSIHCSVSEDAAKETGVYYQECQVSRCSSNANNKEDAKKLWDESLKLTGLQSNFNPFKNK